MDLHDHLKYNRWINSTLYFPCQVNLKGLNFATSDENTFIYCSDITLEVLNEIKNLNIPFILTNTLFSLVYRKHDNEKYSFYHLADFNIIYLEDVYNLFNKLYNSESDDIKLYKLVNLI